jgi:arylsulfatase
LRDPGSPRHGDFSVPHSLDGLTSMTYTPAHVRMPESSVINIKNCSFRITANIEIASSSTADNQHGVIVCQGGNMAGWSLYLDEQSCPTFHYNWFGHEHTSVTSNTPLSAGKHQIVVAFAYDGGFGAGGDVTLFVNNTNVGSARIDKTVPLVYSMSGETFDVGVDTGSPVGPYPHGFDCTAKIYSVVVERLDEPPAEIKQMMRDGEFRASLSTQ